VPQLRATHTLQALALFGRDCQIPAHADAPPRANQLGKERMGPGSPKTRRAGMLSRRVHARIMPTVLLVLACSVRPYRVISALADLERQLLEVSERRYLSVRGHGWLLIGILAHVLTSYKQHRAPSIHR
jgi:hypothetical protein